MANFPNLSRRQLLGSAATITSPEPRLMSGLRLMRDQTQRSKRRHWHLLLRKPRLKSFALSRYFVSMKLLSGTASDKKLASHFCRYQRSFAV
jgi:hypothetical protein